MQTERYKALKEIYDIKPSSRRYFCSLDFFLFFVYYFPHYVKYAFAGFHYVMFNDLNDLTQGSSTLRELGWIIFRESAKTSLAKAFVIYLIMYKKKKYINWDSYDKTNSEQNLFDIVVELQTNPRLIADFGNLYNSERSATEATQKRINNFITTNKIRVEAHSTQESVRGRVHGSQRPDFLILDDFETNTTKESAALSESVQRHIDEFYGAMSPDHQIIYLGNYISDHGTVQKLIDRAKTDPHFRMRNIAVAATVTGPLTWPSKYVWTDVEAAEMNAMRDSDRPVVSLESKKRQMGDSYNAEMMNNPINPDKQEFLRSWFRYITFDQLREKRTRCIVIIDPAGSKRKTADFTGSTVAWQDEKGVRYFKSYKLKVDSRAIMEHLFYVQEAFQPEAIYVEEGMYLLVIKPFLDEEMAKRNKFIVIKPIKHNQTNKQTRIRGLVAPYMSGNIVHIEGQCADLEEQLIIFPEGAHDDVADSAAYTITLDFKPDEVDDYSPDEAPETPRYRDINV